MNSNDFKIKFGTSSNDIDVDTLISSLMYMSNIIQEVNKELGTEKKIEVKIKALEKGSFEIHIELIESILASLFSGTSIGYASDIIQTVGGLFQFAKFLNGKKPAAVTEVNDNSIKVTNSQGETTIFQNSVVNIYNDSGPVRENISKQFSALTKNEEVNDFELYNNRNQLLSHIDRQDFFTLSKKITEETKESEVEVLENEKLQIIRPSFSTDLKWDFVYKGTKISAKMEDEKLIEKVDNGENFSKGDLMVVDLEITKTYDPEFDTFMLNKDSYKILVFKEHIKSGKTGRLF